MEISKTMSRLLRKYKCTLEEYRIIRKNRRKKQLELKRAKHREALSKRKSKDSKSKK
jgi:hypothetical protein